MSTSRFSLLGHEPSALGSEALLGIGLGATALLVLLYVLRERRVRVVVSHAALWLGASPLGADQGLGRAWRRWRSWLLQMSILLALLVGAADLRPKSRGATGRSIVLLIDRSASMGAVVRGGTRLELARAAALRTIAALGPHERLLVASFAATATAESAFASDRAPLEKAVAGISVSPEEGDLATALRFVASVLAGRPAPTLILIGDGGYRDDELSRAAADWTPETIPLEEASEQAEAPGAAGARGAGERGAGARGAVGSVPGNLAITSFAAEGGAARPAEPPGRVTASLIVRRYGGPAGTVPVEIRDDLGRLIAAREVLVDAGQAVTERFSLTAPATLGLTARILTPVGLSNALAFDDVAFTAVPQQRLRRILVSGAPNLYLDGALISLGPTVEVTRLSPRDLEGARVSLRDYDLVIFDGAAPVPAPTEGRYLYLGVRGPGSPFPVRGPPTRDPVVVRVDREHPVTRHLPLADLNLREAYGMQPAAGDRVLASAFAAPLVLAREKERLKIVALAFDMRRSDLPLRPALPLLVANTLDWMSPPRDLPAQQHRVGTRATVALASRRITHVDVAGPDGGSSTISASGGAVEIPLPLPGLYRVSPQGSEDGPITLAANLRLPRESDTSAPPPAAWTSTQRVPVAPEPARHLDVTTLALALAALLLAAEWWSLHRGWTV